VVLSGEGEDSDELILQINVVAVSVTQSVTRESDGDVHDTYMIY
jgi:hypothetical protein